jgi:hypothetical protein
MIAMQYSFTLPADYDMGIVASRIAERGHMTDDFPGLRFKAYLSARARQDVRGSENLYAPFYLWRDVEGMNAFLCGHGFEGVSAAFGRPSVKLWSVLDAELDDDLAAAAHATREVIQLAASTDLTALRLVERDRVRAYRDAGALAVVSAFEPTTWSLVRFRLWSGTTEAPGDGARYEVGHMSRPSQT